MPWNQFTLDVPEDLKDAVIGELSAIGAAGIWESAEPAPGTVRLVAYFGSFIEPTEIREPLQPVFERALLPLPAILHENVADQDWNEEWKRSYSSFTIGTRFFVIPSWRDDAVPAGRIPIRLDPGQAFGTGTHETTQLTLEALEPRVEPGHTIVDLGTGSGILAISCFKLGASGTLACDNDPVACVVAEDNIRRNTGAIGRLLCGSIDAFRSESIDIVLGNLTADVIKDLLPEVVRTLRPSGLAILSGILTWQQDNVVAVASSLGFRIEGQAERGEWAALVVRKHGH